MFKLEIKADNAAFGNAGPEIARILREVADRMDSVSAAAPSGNIQDINGNTVAWFDLSND